MKDRIVQLGRSDFDELNGLLAYPEEYFSASPSGAGASGIVPSDYLEDGRGDVLRWENREGRRTISREVWNDETDGEGKARLGIGRNF